MKQSTTLSQLAPGSKFKLFSRYRDKTPRPKYRFGGRTLKGLTLEVREHTGVDAVVCLAGGTQEVVMWAGLRVLL